MKTGRVLYLYTPPSNKTQENSDQKWEKRFFMVKDQLLFEIKLPLLEFGTNL